MNPLSNAITIKLPAAGAPVAGPAARVLYVADSSLNAMVIRLMLRQRRPDMAIDVCETGKAGLEQLRKQTPELLLIDINLPDTNGPALLKTVRDNPSYRNIPAVATSVPMLPSDVAALMQAGFMQFLPKPVSADHFLAIINTLFPQASAGQRR